jgi:NDP-sugar pyrophosphorylase family protein/lipopolysaccharide/colanic/teichoic acid biosynthesis glycosyltransferase
MQAMLIATGEENKLLPLTATMPAPMVPIVDRPVMVYAIELLARAGFRDIQVSVYEQANAIESYCGHGERWSVQLHFLLQRTAGGGAGSLKRAEPLLTETFIVLPADRLIDLDIQAAIRFHRAHGGMATAILARPTEADHRLSGYATVDLHGRLQDLGPSATGSKVYDYTGAFIFEPAVLPYIAAQGKQECHTDLLTALRQAGKPVYGYLMDGYWNPLLNFADYQAAQLAVLGSAGRVPEAGPGERIRHPYLEAGEMQPGIWVGPNSIIHPTAQLRPPLFIGAGCRIGPNTELGPETIIGAGTVLDEGVTIQQSTVLPRTYIGQLLHLARRIAHRTDLIDIDSGINVQIADPWMLTTVNPALPGNLLRTLVERALALLLLIGLAPFLLVIGAALWLATGSAPLTRVQRFGQIPLVKSNPQLINLYHWQTRRADGTITPLGGWVERYEFHRLPELWNVVQGDLGLVGVKPLAREESILLQEAWQQSRYGAQAGFTGLWYTEATATTDADELSILDAYQALAHNWRDDLRQLGLTPGAWLRRVRQSHQPQSAEAVGAPQPLNQAHSIQVFYSEQEPQARMTAMRHEQSAPLLLSPSDQR